MVTQGAEHTIEHADDLLETCRPETCIILLTNITTNKLKKEKELP